MGNIGVPKFLTDPRVLALSTLGLAACPTPTGPSTISPGNFNAAPVHKIENRGGILVETQEVEGGFKLTMKGADRENGIGTIDMKCFADNRTKLMTCVGSCNGAEVDFSCEKATCENEMANACPKPLSPEDVKELAHEQEAEDPRRNCETNNLTMSCEVPGKTKIVCDFSEVGNASCEVTVLHEQGADKLRREFEKNGKDCNRGPVKYISEQRDGSIKVISC